MKDRQFEIEEKIKNLQNEMENELRKINQMSIFQLIKYSLIKYLQKEIKCNIDKKK